MRVLLIFLPTKTLNCCDKRKHNVIFELRTEKNCENQTTIRGRSRCFWWGQRWWLATQSTFPGSAHEDGQTIGYEQDFIEDKISRKTEGRLRLSYKNLHFFSGLLELYKIFQKWRSLWGLMEGIFINFNICLYVAQKTTPARNNSPTTTLVPLVDAKGHLFLFSSSQLRSVLSMSKCSSCCRTRHS